MSLVIAYLGVSIEEFSLDILKIRIIECKLPLQGPIGHAAAALEHG